MRYSPEHKEKTRAQMLTAAAQQMRLRGPDGVSVAALMRRVGLTHGGFYAHFKSKDQLIAAAVATMFEHSRKLRERSLQGATSLDSLIEAYLSNVHRDNPAQGCPIPALMSESVRWTRAARQAFDMGIANMADRVAGLMPAHIADKRAAAFAMIAQMAGAIALARTFVDPQLAATLLGGCRRDLHQRYGSESAPRI